MDHSSSSIRYTTAGTLYKPESSKPLNPPERRGRNKWSTPTNNLDHGLSANFAQLQMNKGNEDSRYDALQQYMPLQQNSDKAANPLQARSTDREDTMSPFIGLGGIHPQGPFASTDREWAVGDHCESGEETDATTDPLMSMPVKSLQNLASYPNPNQERAQEALQCGKKPSLMTPNGMDLPAKCAALSHGITNGVYKSPQRMRPKSPQWFQRSKEEDDEYAAHVLRQDGSSNANQRQNFSVSNLDGELGNSYVARAAASSRPRPIGIGVPRPITAGPPGQRQYQRQKLETPTGIVNTRVSQNWLSGDMKPDIGKSKPIFDAKFFATGFRDSLLPVPGRVEVVNRKYPSELTEADILPAVPRLSVPTTVFGTVGSMADSRTVLPGAHQTPGHDNACGSREERLQARLKRVDDLWYAGSDMLGKTTSDFLNDYHGRDQTNYIGAVGDGRPSATPKAYPPIDSEQARRMSVAQHAEPLVNMMFGSLLRNLDPYSDNRLNVTVEHEQDDGEDVEFLNTSLMKALAERAE